MRPVLRVDAGPVVDVHAVKKGLVDSDRLVEDTLQLVQGSGSEGRSRDAEVVAAFNEFLTGPESYSYNGIAPGSDDGDREKLLQHWRGFSMGGEVGPNLEDRSELADKIDSADLDAVEEDLEGLGLWMADTYTDRGTHRPKTAYQKNGIMQLETSLGVMDEENNELRVLKPGELGEREIMDSALRLVASDAETVQVLGLQEGVEQRELDNEVAQEIIGEDVKDILEESSGFYKAVLEETAEEIRAETGLGFEEIGGHEFINIVRSSELEAGEEVDDIVSDAFSKASEEYDDYEQIQKGAAEYVSEWIGLVFPAGMDAEQYLSAVSGAEMADISVIDLLEENARDRAEDISDTTQLSGKAFMSLRDLEEGEVFRDTDENGKRVYRWNEGSAYSVTTIINPLPTSHVEIDTGGGLFHWKNIYDGSDGRYDSDIIRDYAGYRGTLAHEEVFSNYVEDESEVRGDTEDTWGKLEEIAPDEEGLGDLQDVVDWKEQESDEVLEYSERDEGFVQDGRDLAEKEIKWIEETFRGLEEELGLSKENVIYAEEEFAMETVHPWDESEQIEGPGIGKFSYGGTADMIYEHEKTGETVLLDLKTGSMKPDYAIQQAAYKHAIENSDFFDDPRLEGGIDRVVVPEIDPESMMYSDRDPVIHTDQPHQGDLYTTSKFLDASDVDLESSVYRKNQWRPENWDEEALYLFARAAEQMPEP